MEHIRITTKKLIQDWGARRHDKTGALERGFKKILTKQEQKHIKYYLLKDSRLILGVDSSVWLYIFNLKKRQLLRNLNLNQILGPGEATEIILQLDAGKANKR
jgi:hypothetical protein